MTAKNTTPVDVNAKPKDAESNGVPEEARVKTSGSPKNIIPEQISSDEPLENGVSEKKSLKARFSDLTAKLKANKKTVIIVTSTVVGVAGAATVAILAYAKQQAEAPVESYEGAEGDDSLDKSSV